MSLQQLLEFNQRFVKNRGYLNYQTDKLPTLKRAILSCMDTRLTELLPAAMGIKNGDVKLIKNAGAVVSHPWGSVMRSLILSVLELGVEEILVIGHYDCGLQGCTYGQILPKIESQGVSPETLNLLEAAGVPLRDWLTGFTSVEDSVKESVKRIKMHPLMPSHIQVHGLVIDPETGKLDLMTV